MAISYRLKVVTPERVMWDGDVTEIIVRTTEGEIGVLAHHMQIISPLMPHLMTVYQPNGKIEQMTVSGGFIEVKDDGVTILADSSETADMVDVARAQRARDRALEILNVPNSNALVDVARAQRALARSENRLKLAGKDVQNLGR